MAGDKVLVLCATGPAGIILLYCIRADGRVYSNDFEMEADSLESPVPRRRNTTRTANHIQVLEERLRGVESLLRTCLPSTVIKDAGKDDIPSKAKRRNPGFHIVSGRLRKAGKIQFIWVSKFHSSDIKGTKYDAVTHEPAGSWLVLEDVSKFWPLLDAKLLLVMMHEQNIAGLDNYYQDPPRWATVNAFLALGIQWKAASNAIGDLFPVSWAYFKNAFSIFSQLIVQGKDLRACLAVLLMALFMHGTGDMRAASSLIAAAAHLLQVVGLYRRDCNLDMGFEEAEENRRVFWMIHIISNDIALKSGLPAPSSDDHIGIELPTQAPPNDMTLPGTNLLRFMAQLSIIQSKVLKELYAAKPSRQSLDVYLSNVARLDHQLEDWKTALPPELQPMSDIALSDPALEPSITHLHLAYYATAWKLRNATPHRERELGLNDELMQDASLRHELLNIQWLSPSPLNGARASVLLALHATSLPPFPQLWQTLSYTISAALVLVAGILHNPLSQDTQLNADILRRFVSHLKFLNAQGEYDLRNVLTGISKLYELSLYALSASHDNLMTGGPESGGAGQTGLGEQCEHIRAGLGEAGDLMHVSLGLMGNMPHLCANAAKIFSNLFGMSWTSADGFGPFVPAMLQPSHYDFVFGPR
ncbi:hypothetical protein S7711_09114 [Stachybotrys chartarum IBT 7711]|uniref:Xylanolytic transcriptional activator regulatory domain-containing protein n=1 Tax=Stachybotrys chartarum (strain CBS 109288 / IBT 7711) TaxID=1280523 RepID=A0A084B2X9_STACB|nr:hypothetical protein S7711_09114 [Stachybotrys chartarum IBT 7711]